MTIFRFYFLFFLTIVLCVPSLACVTLTQDSTAHYLHNPTDTLSSTTDNIFLSQPHQHNDSCVESTAAFSNKPQTLSATCATFPPHSVQHWRAIGECAATHLSIWGYAYWVQKADFAQLSWESLRNNMRLHPWVWDGDLIYVNFFDHPYHGNLYFNAARSNGANFWTSAAYSTVGAFVWEVAGERELLSINDLLSTSFGGVALGETTYRLSDLLIDERKRGFSRLLSEVGAGIINPMRFINRLLTGEAWRKRTKHTSFQPTHYRSRYTLGWQSQNNNHLPTRHSAFVHIDVDYGTPISEEKSSYPYDHFQLSLGLGKDGHRNSVTQLSIIGRLKAWRTSEGTFSSEVGWYQHFNYLYAAPTPTAHIPYRLAESASLGPALRGQWQKQNFRFVQSLFGTAILMGAIINDYEEPYAQKNYNFASGFALRSQTHFSLRSYLNASFDAHYYRLFTWADKNNHGAMGAQGDRAVAQMWILSPHIDVQLTPHWGLSCTARFFHRNSHYAFHPDKRSSSSEWQIGLCYTLGQ